MSQEHDQDRMQIDGPVVAVEEFLTSIQSDEQQLQQVSEQETATITDATTHSSLRWAMGHVSSPSWTTIGSIRFANIVHFEIRIHDLRNLGENDWTCLTEGEHRFSYYSMLKSSFPTTPDRLAQLIALWTPQFAIDQPYDLAGATHITICFQTFCDPLTWKITRLLHCVLCKGNFLPAVHGFAGGVTQDFSRSLDEAILRVRNLSGRDSVWYALRGTIMLLLPQYYGRLKGFKWISGRFNDLITQLSDQDSFAQHCVSKGPLCIESSSDIPLQSTIPELVQDTRSGETMLAIRSPSSPSDCPRFCLFVLSNKALDSEATIHRLLAEAVTQRNIYGPDGYQWSDSDWTALQQWRKALARSK